MLRWILVILACLGVAQAGDKAKLLSACKDNNVEEIRSLIEAGVGPNVRTSTGITPLMFACARGQEDLVTWLLDRGAKHRVRSHSGDSAITLATVNQRVGCVKVLLDHGADIDAENYEGRSCLGLAVLKHDPDMVQFLIQAGARVDHEDEDGNTPLMLALFLGDLEIVQALLEGGADVWRKNEWDMCPANVADVVRQDLDAAPFLLDLRSRRTSESPLFSAIRANDAAQVEFLIQAGTALNQMSDAGMTPLMVAVARGRLDMLRLLLDAGANLSLASPQGVTAWHLAVESGQPDMVRVLRKHGEKAIPLPGADQEDVDGLRKVLAAAMPSNRFPIRVPEMASVAEGGRLPRHEPPPGRRGITLPTFTRQPKSRIPRSAARFPIPATVKLECTFGADGRVRDLRVLESSTGWRFGYPYAAIQAVKTWEYQPARDLDAEVDMRMHVLVSFEVR